MGRQRASSGISALDREGGAQKRSVELIRGHGLCRWSMASSRSPTSGSCLATYRGRTSRSRAACAASGTHRIRRDRADRDRPADPRRRRRIRPLTLRRAASYRRQPAAGANRRLVPRWPSRRQCRFLFCRPATLTRAVLGPHHSRHCFKSVRRRRAAARQGSQEPAEQASPVSHDPDPTDLNDQTEQVEPQAVRNVQDHTLYRRRHCLSSH